VSQLAVIAINESVRARVPTLFVAARIVRNSSRPPDESDLDQRKAALIHEWEGRSGQQLANHTLVRAYRRLARQLGIQLTPAVEGLYRRGILRGRFPTISPLVDTANVLSAEQLVPIGVFDLDRVQGAVELTLSTPGESFVPIGKDGPVALADGTPVLRDALGAFSAIGARDSARTMIAAGTTSVLAVSWGFQEVDAALINATLDTYVERVQVSRPR
jgi:DNA/RNA-binding domain of Phe-tRNA-synthetase-like protein